MSDHAQLSHHKREIVYALLGLAVAFGFLSLVAFGYVEAVPASVPH